jgi:phosphoribosylanthranilate isomerase
MNLWVKICGNTSLDDARLAVEAGADAVGFVFAPSPRRITFARAGAIVQCLPADFEKIGVFVNDNLAEIEEAVQTCGLTGVQLHGEVSLEASGWLKARFGARLRILCVVHFGPDAAQHAAAYARNPNVDALLIDSRTATAVGGTGVTFDWQAARETLFCGAHARMVVAGGLTPANVGEAIRTLHPWGVDVVSGVEAVPGRKDPEKVRRFIAQARRTALALENQIS